jgi:hypothetical protein
MQCGQRNVKKPPAVLPLMGVPITPNLSTGRTLPTTKDPPTLENARERVRSRSPAGVRHSSRHPTDRHAGQEGKDSLELEAVLQAQIAVLARQLEEAKSKPGGSGSRYRR